MTWAKSEQIRDVAGDGDDVQKLGMQKVSKAQSLQCIQYL